ncbi:GNAT family N-acetyltransferase [Rhizobium lusitanum]|uniref:GNAT family N-acetyltransferase n=1 Tax=Rhizobium lusitanum TaxID=293958 RepID=UPI0015728935|nr:GNAT family N-acetyltransferase [Rhizobium lusitanum]NTJ11772.1 GNAT family N-acetyltransferase [Rhizobium lusitanum]
MSANKSAENDIRVRLATEADVDVLGGYGAQLIAIHHEWDRLRFISASPRTPPMYSNYLRNQLGKPGVVVLAAEVEGEIVGYVYAGVEGPDYMALRGPAGVVHDIFVAESQRRRGAGRALLAAAVEGLTQLGASQIVLSTAHRNVAGQRLFVGMGFQPTMVELTLRIKDIATP